MKGTRPLDNNEITLVSTCFAGTFEVRKRGLFMLGVTPLLSGSLKNFDDKTLL